VIPTAGAGVACEGTMEDEKTDDYVLMLPAKAGNGQNHSGIPLFSNIS